MAPHTVCVDEVRDACVGACILLMALAVLPDGFDRADGQHKGEGHGAADAAVWRDGAPPCQGRLQEKVEVCDAGKHFKEKDGEKRDDVVLGGDDEVAGDPGGRLQARRDDATSLLANRWLSVVRAVSVAYRERRGGVQRGVVLLFHRVAGHLTWLHTGASRLGARRVHVNGGVSNCCALSTA